MIDYPNDAAIEGEAQRHALPIDVLVRDLARIVEVLNLTERGFLHKKSVLAGSMALRTAGSPRFTVYDADFSIGGDDQPRPDEIRSALSYADDDIEIKPGGEKPFDDRGSGWIFEPVTFDPIFTDFVSTDQFKADISLRGLVEDGVEAPLKVPYDLGLWDEPPVVWVMSIHEVIAEKTLGWCVHGLAKHYADLGYITGASLAGHITLESSRLREVLDAKLQTMSRLQPKRYANFPTIEDVIGKLKEFPAIDQNQWNGLIYPKTTAGTYELENVRKLIHGWLVPLFEGKVQRSPNP